MKKRRTCNLECYICHKYGHIARYCRQKVVKVWRRREVDGNKLLKDMPKQEKEKEGKYHLALFNPSKEEVATVKPKEV